MSKLKVVVASLTVGLVALTPVAAAQAGPPPEHCDSELGFDPCKPISILCKRIDEATKGRVTCGD